MHYNRIKFIGTKEEVDSFVAKLYTKGTTIEIAKQGTHSNPIYVIVDAEPNTPENIMTNEVIPYLSNFPTDSIVSILKDSFTLGEYVSDATREAVETYGPLLGSKLERQEVKLKSINPYADDTDDVYIATLTFLTKYRVSLDFYKEIVNIYPESLLRVAVGEDDRTDSNPETAIKGYAEYALYEKFCIPKVILGAYADPIERQLTFASEFADVIFIE